MIWSFSYSIFPIGGTETNLLLAPNFTNARLFFHLTFFVQQTSLDEMELDLWRD